MSKIFNSIARYQGNRYNDYRNVLSRMELMLKEYSNNSIDQTHLQQSLDKLVDTVKSTPREDKAYKECLSTMERFKNSLVNDPMISPSSSYERYGNFTNVFAERYQVNTDQSNIIQSVKSDIRSLKGSLLSRRNFPTTRQSIVPPPQTAVFMPPPPTIANHNHPRNKYQREMN